MPDGHHLDEHGRVTIVGGKGGQGNITTNRLLGYVLTPIYENDPIELNQITRSCTHKYYTYGRYFVKGRIGPARRQVEQMGTHTTLPL